MPISRSTWRGKARQRLARRCRPCSRCGARQIEKRLVDRDRLDQRREVEHQRAHLARDRGIFRHVGRITVACGQSRRASNIGIAERTPKVRAIVAGGRDHAALAAADDQRLVGERRIVALLDGGVERVAIDMRD